MKNRQRHMILRYVFLLLAAFSLRSAELYPVDPEPLDDFRVRLKALARLPEPLLQARDNVVRELSAVSHRAKAEDLLVQTVADRAVNILEFARLTREISRLPFNGTAPFLPVEASAFPSLPAHPDIFSAEQTVTETFQAAAAQGEETEIECRFYHLLDPQEMELIPHDFRNASGDPLPAAAVSFIRTRKAQASALPSVYRAVFRIPENAAPGLYKAPLEIRCGGKTFELNILLRVYPFRLPQPEAFDGGAWLAFTPSEDGASYGEPGGCVIRRERKPEEKNVFLLHPEKTLLPESVLKEGSIATHGETDRFIHIPADRILHIQDTLDQKSAARWHAIHGRILFAPDSLCAGSPELRREAGLKAYRAHYDGVFFAEGFHGPALREALNDVRYITMLRALLKRAYAEKNQQAVFIGKKAVAWFMLLDPQTYNLDLMRFELADYIAAMLAEFGKSGTEGKP